MPRKVFVMQTNASSCSVFGPAPLIDPDSYSGRCGLIGVPEGVRRTEAFRGRLHCAIFSPLLTQLIASRCFTSQRERGRTWHWCSTPCDVTHVGTEHTACWSYYQLGLTLQCVQMKCVIPPAQEEQTEEEGNGEARCVNHMKNSD